MRDAPKEDGAGGPGDGSEAFQFGHPGTGEFEDVGAPAWTTTFGDLMSLLLTFFVLMYTMSELKIERFAVARASLSDAFGGVAVLPPAAPSGAVPRPISSLPSPGASAPATEEDAAGGLDEDRLFEVTDAYLERIAQELEELIEESGLQETLSVIRSAEGVRLRILSTTLFHSGSALLNEDKEWILSVLAEITASLDVPAVVAGHTDDLPIHASPFYSNWELSAARAAGIARALVANGHDPLTIRVEAFGEHQPVATNDTPEGRALNRRVEILFSREGILDSARRWIAEGRAGRDVGGGAVSGLESGPATDLTRGSEEEADAREDS